MINVRPAALSTPAADGARLMALDALLQTAAAARRLSDPADAEALHDFRVALRRLRSTVRAYRPLLDHLVSGRLRRRMRDLAAATSAGRDAEVHVAWLAAREPDLARPARAAVRRLRTRLEARRRETRGDVALEVQRRFDKLERQLGRRLSGAPDGADPGPPFGHAAADAARRLEADLIGALGAVSTAADGATAHRARIAAKRLRYLLEPLRAAVPGAAALVKRLKHLQDQFGAFQDLRLLADEARGTVADEAAARAGRLFDRALEPGPGAPPHARRRSDAGVLAVAALVREEQDRLFGEIEREWLGERVRDLGVAVHRVIAALAGDATSDSSAPAAPRRAPRPARSTRARVS